MNYLPLSISAVKSCDMYRSIDVRGDYMINTCASIRSAIIYSGDDNPLTNWAKENTLNMLHLQRFLRRASEHETFVFSDGYDGEMEFNLGCEDGGATTDDGYITTRICGEIIKMNVRKKNKKRNDFLFEKPFTISNEKIMDSPVWYNRLYMSIITGSINLRRRCNFIGGEIILADNIYSNIPLSKSEEFIEMTDGIFWATEMMPEIL